MLFFDFRNESGEKRRSVTKKALLDFIITLFSGLKYINYEGSTALNNIAAKLAKCKEHISKMAEKERKCITNRRKSKCGAVYINNNV